MCDTQTKLLYFVLQETRASWKTGEMVNVETRGDDGVPKQPSAGTVITPNRVMVSEPATFDIFTMGQSTVWFALGAGGYARLFPTTNFKKSLEPVLQACGDHW